MEEDFKWMLQTIALGERGRLTAPPNPWVGCLIVQRGEVVGQGYHSAAGTPHAEVHALEQAGSRAKGATVYVTLEPCAHHGRTPPCCDALIEAQVGRVVVPFLDPDARVCGKGRAYLEAAGIPVTSDVACAEAMRSLLPYLHHRKTGRPYCILKIASSLDGQAATSHGESKWITGEEARRDVHRLRAASQAILIGSRTALLDRPLLTVRHIEEPYHPPLRLLIDSKGVVPLDSPLFETAEAPTLVFCTEQTPKHYRDNLNKRCVELALLPPHRPLEYMLELLGKRGILQLLVEGGPTLHAALRHAQLADRYTIYLGNCLLGMPGIAALQTPGIAHMEEALRWSLDTLFRFGNDLRLDFT